MREIEQERKRERKREPEGVIQRGSERVVRERESAKGREFKLSAMLWDRLIC